MTRILVLNAGYEPLQLVSWEKGLCLVLANKAEVVEKSKAVARSVSCSIELPSVVRLVRYVHNVSKVTLVRCSRKNILLRDRYHCQYCGTKCKPSTATVDHIVPRALGGKTTWTNAVVACPPCNRKKGSRHLEASGMKLLRQPRRPTWSELYVTPSEQVSILLGRSFQEISGRESQVHESWLKYLIA